MLILHDSQTSLDDSIEKMNGQRTQKDPGGWTKTGGSPHLSHLLESDAGFILFHHSCCEGDNMNEVISKAGGAPQLSSPSLLWVPDSCCPSITVAEGVRT